MTNFSILQKDITDVSLAFARYQRMFAQYSAQLAKNPAYLKAMNQQYAGGHANLQKMNATVQMYNQQLQKMAQIYGTQNKQLTQAASLWGAIGKSVASVTSNILSATRWLISWRGMLGDISSGLLGFGGLFGIDKMARSAADSRRSAMGLGLSIGEQRAFQINFQRAVDPDSFLSWISQMEGDPAKAAAASAIGIRMTGNTERDALSAMRRLRAWGQSTPAGIQGLMIDRLGLGVSLENMRTITGLPQDEFERMFTGNARDASRLNIPDRTAEAWTDFVKRLDEAKSSIFATFVQGLLPLRKPLEHLSGAFEKFLTTLMNSDMVKHAIENVATWLNNFAGTLSKPEFLDNVKRFFSDIGDLADFIHTITHPIQSIEDWANKDTGAAPRAQRQRFLEQLNTVEENSGLPKGILGYQFMKESGGSFNPPDNQGHVGAFQFDPNTAKWLNKLYHKHLDPRKPGEAAILASYYDDWLIRHYGGDVKNALAAYNWGPENMDAYLKTGRGAKGQPMPDETRTYMGDARVSGFGSNVRVDIYNHTGSDVVVSHAQLAAH